MKKIDTNSDKKQLSFDVVSPLLPEKTQDAHFVKEKRLGAVCADRVEIWKASIEESGQPCAVKFMPKSEIATGQIDESLILSEIKVLQSVHHPNIVRLLQVVSDEDNYQVAVEFVAGTNLVARMDNKAISDSEGAHMMYQVLLGLEYLHEKNIVHRNITSKSVMVMPIKCVGDPATVKVTDLSLASFFPHGEGLTRQIGRLSYMAPEMVKSERYN